MTSLRRKIGLANIKQLYGSIGAEGLENTARLAPKLEQYICDFAYGDIYSRNALSFQQKQLVTISSLLTQGCVQNELKLHMLGGVNAGLTEEQILDVCIHCLPYVGFPKVTAALEIAHALFNKVSYDDAN